MNVGVEPSIFNWSSDTPLQQKPLKDRSSSSTKACTSTTDAGGKAVMSPIETVEELASTCQTTTTYSLLLLNCPQSPGSIIEVSQDNQ